MEYSNICKKLYEASIQAGVVALAMQKDITNEGKIVEQEEGEDADHLAMRQAKTKVDVMVQDMLLTALREYREELFLDVEEESECLSWYSKEHKAHTLIMDPIDGTLEYLRQKDTYSICSALISKGDLKVAVVYFPSRNILYCYEPAMGARFFDQAQLSSWDQGKAIANGGEGKKVVYKNDRVDQDLVDIFTSAGYKVMDDRTCNCPEALIHCMNKEALCYLCDHRNIRDILMGAILSKSEGGALLDSHGNEVEWPSHGRLPFGIFTRFPDEVKVILSAMQKEEK